MTGILIGVALIAQPAAPAFEVASIRPSADPPGSPSGIAENKGRISARNVTLKRCMRGAYGIEESRIAGGPKWAGEDRYDIEAKGQPGRGGHDLMLMLQTLLSERFRLAFHREQRELSGYRLAPGGSGLKAEQSSPESRSVGNASRGRIEGQGYTMAQFAMKLSEALHEPVSDATSTAGRFDLKLEWTPEDMRARPPSAGDTATDARDGPSIFTALREQLGLKLESSRISAEVLVIDSAAKPSEN